MCERYINQLLLTRPYLGAWPATWACALTGNQTGNQTGNPSVRRVRFYLFILRERKMEKEREGEKQWCERETLRSLLYTPERGPGPKPRPVP